MATYQALVAQNDDGSVRKVLLVRTEPMKGLPNELLRELQDYACTKFGLSVSMVDLETAEIDDLKPRIRAMSRGR